MLTPVANVYGSPRLEAKGGGGESNTWLLQRSSELASSFTVLNENFLCKPVLYSHVSHVEPIRSFPAGGVYCLKTSARVGGARTAKLVERSTGMHLWTEWAKIEAAVARGERYSPLAPRSEYAGLLVPLARQEWPDISGFDEPELVWPLNKRTMLGLADSLVRVRAGRSTTRRIRLPRSKDFPCFCSPS